MIWNYSIVISDCCPRIWRNCRSMWISQQTLLALTRSLCVEPDRWSASIGNCCGTKALTSHWMNIRHSWRDICCIVRSNINEQDTPNQAMAYVLDKYDDVCDDMYRRRRGRENLVISFGFNNNCICIPLRLIGFYRTIKHILRINVLLK